MNLEELERIKKEIKDYEIEVIISLWNITLKEINRRMEKKKNE